MEERRRPGLFEQSWKAYFVTLAGALGLAWGLLQMRGNSDQLVRDIAYAGVIGACAFAVVLVLIILFRATTELWPGVVRPKAIAVFSDLAGSAAPSSGPRELQQGREILLECAQEAADYAAGPCRPADWNEWHKRATITLTTGFRATVEEEYRDSLRGDAGQNCELYFARAAQWLRSKAKDLTEKDLKPGGHAM